MPYLIDFFKSPETQLQSVKLIMILAYRLGRYQSTKELLPHILGLFEVNTTISALHYTFIDIFFFRDADLWKY